MLTELVKVQARKTNVNHVTEVAGYLEVFTAPAIFIFMNGQEVYRGARFIPINELKQRIERIYDSL